eukprot:Phypoly_transcript_04715.p1 GENE.Phypoly_transcript_04715~~Phypoly_transcript_04715.p1  ORF type:complete len:607 (+),score=136.27 Phypoly_transcript_04715:163-1983(+)
MSGILDKCVFVIDQFIPLKKKVELIRMIKTNGGISVYSVSEKSTHLVTSQEGFLEGSAKVQAAKNLGLHVVSKEFVIDSIARGEKQDESNYNFSNMAQQSPSSSTTPTTIPALTVTIPTRPANSPLSSTSPRSPPGFNNIRAPNQQPQLNVGDKKGFGRLRVDVNNKGQPSPQPTPSPKSPMYATSESAHTEDEEDDDDEDDDENSSDDEPGKPSFRDVLEHSNSSKQPRAWESATPQYGMEDDGCKIFVGGIMFDDLEALKKTKDGYSASEEVIAHIQKLKNERLIEIIRIFSRFGTVVRVKQFLEKRHIFITYDNKNSALQALRALKPLEVRKKIVQEVRERLRAEDRQTLVSPRSNFYVRWPHHVESEDGGYSSNSRSYFSSGSSAPSSPTASSLPTHKLSWRQPQPQSPTAAYTPYQRSYFTQNNFIPASRSSSMRSYFSNSESDYEASNNLNSFSESESSQYSRSARTQHYQQHAHTHAQQQPAQRATDSTIAKTVLSESDSDAPTGIRHRVIDRSIDRSTQDSSTPTSSPPNPSSTSTTSSAQAEASVSPVSTSPSAHPSTPSTPAYTHKRPVNEEGNWQRVLVLLLILASMAIVYLYIK